MAHLVQTIQIVHAVGDVCGAHSPIMKEVERLAQEGPKGKMCDG